MKKHTFVFECGTEEIPARFMMGLLAYLQEAFENKLEQERLAYGSCSVLGTYRRLVVKVEGLAGFQTEESEVIKGPPKRIAYDESNHKWLPAGLGFAKKQGVHVDALSIQSIDGVDYVRVSKEKIVNSAAEVLPPILTDILKRMPLPIEMKWGVGEHSFFRPVHWFLVMLDGDVVPFQYAGQTSGSVTYGHRFLTKHSDAFLSASGAAVEVGHARDLEAVLHQNFVCLDHHQRRQQIESDLCRYDVCLEDYDALINEVVFLTECPVLIEGGFPSDYLSVPAPFIIECMTQHQKYFPIFDQGQLTHRFLIVADNVTDANKSIIRKGNERVLNARLADVQFFWDQDKKKPLMENYEKLNGVVYQKNAGTLKDKVQRMEQIVLAFSKRVKMDVDAVVRVVQLCKADLVSNLVFELPKLQGEAGALLAAYQGEDVAIVEGVREHYKPVQSQSALPKNDNAAWVALADKLDALCIHFREGLIPTGSQDPFGLRRQLIGVFRILQTFNWGLSLEECIKIAQKATSFTQDEGPLYVFLEQRLHTFLMDQGLRHDMAASVLRKAIHSPINGVIQQAKSWLDYEQNFYPQAKMIVESAVRIKRLAQPVSVSVSPDLFQDDIEKDVWQHYQVMDADKHQLGWEQTAEFSAAIECYFERIMVMDKDTKVRDNRLACLEKYAKLYDFFLEFDKVVLES